MRVGVGLVVAAILSLSATCAVAEDDVTSPQMKRCLDASGGVTAAMRECQSEEIARQDKRLNQVYQSLMRRVSEKQASELRTAQRAWLAYREATCGLIFTFGTGGTIDLINVGGCEVDSRARRVKFLETLHAGE